MHLDDQAPPVAPWVVYLQSLARAPLSTTKVAREALRTTAGRIGLRLNSVSVTLRRLEEEGAVTSEKPNPKHATVVWTLTDNGRWLLDEARRMARVVLDVELRGENDGTQRTEQPPQQRR